MTDSIVENYNEDAADETLFSRALKITFGASQYGSDGDWRTSDRTVESLIRQDFSKPYERDDKDGRCLLQGALHGRWRSKAEVCRNHLMIFDFDTGIDFDRLVQLAKDRGLLAVVHTSHNHMKKTTKINRRALWKFLGRDVEDVDYTPTDEDLTRYRREFLKVEPEHLEGTKFAGWVPQKGVPAKGKRKEIKADPHHSITVAHSALPKMRLVLFLAETFEFGEPGTVHHADRTQAWAEVYLAVSESFGVYCDPQCQDASRLFFLPSYKPGAEHRVAVVHGNAFDLSTVKVPARPTGNATGRAKVERRERVTIQALPGLDHFMRLYGARLDVAQIATDFGEGVGMRSNGPGVECECPLGHEHGNGNRRGFFASRTEGRRPLLHCCHETHHDFTTEDFVEAFVVGVGVEIDGETVEINHAADLWRYVAAKVIGEWCKVVAPFESADDMKAACTVRKGEDEEHCLALARRVGVMVDADSSVALAMLERLKKSGCPIGPLKAALKEGVQSRPTPPREKKAEAEMEMETTSTLSLPRPYYERGGWIMKPSGSDEVPDSEVCSAFCKQPSLVRDPDGDGWGLQVTFEDTDGREKSLVLTARRIQNDRPGIMGDLAQKGLVILASQACHGMVADMLSKMIADPTLPRVTELNRPGWHGESWCSSIGEVVGGKEGESYTLSKAGGVTVRKKKGTLEGEQAVINACYDLPTHWHWGYAPCIAFAGPVSQLAGLESGGYWVYGDTHIGKSLMGHIIAMPFSSSTKGGNWVNLGGTENSAEATLIQATGNALCLDEAKSSKARKVAVELSMKISREEERPRMDYSRDGQSQNKATVGWHVGQAVVNCEWSMERCYELEGEKMAAGEVNRMACLKMESEKVLLRPVGDPTVKALEKHKKHYGHTGPLFVAALIADGWATEDGKQQLEEEIDEKVIDLITGWNAGSRIAKRFAAAWWAGEFAQKQGLIPAKANIKAIVRKAWESFRGSDESRRLEGAVVAVDVLRTFLVKNWNRTIVPVDRMAEGERNTAEVGGYYTERTIHLFRDRVVEASGGTHPLDAVLVEMLAGGFLEERKHKGKTDIQSRTIHSYIPKVGDDLDHIRIDRVSFGITDSILAPAGEDSAPGNGWDAIQKCVGLLKTLMQPVPPLPAPDAADSTHWGFAGYLEALVKGAEKMLRV